MIAISVSACGANTQGSFCSIYRPVFTSPNDTEETKQQVDENNIIYEEKC